MRAVVAFLLLFACAARENAAAPPPPSQPVVVQTEEFRGVYHVGDERNAFEPCGKTESWWIDFSDSAREDGPKVAEGRRRNNGEQK